MKTKTQPSQKKKKPTQSFLNVPINQWDANLGGGKGKKKKIKEPNQEQNLKVEE